MLIDMLTPMGVICLGAVYAYITIVFIYTNKIIERKVSFIVLLGIMPFCIILLITLMLIAGLHIAIIYIVLVITLLICFMISFKGRFSHLYWGALNFIFHMITLRGMLIGAYALIEQSDMSKVVANKDSYLLSLMISMCIMVVFLFLFNKYVNVKKVKVLLNNRAQLRFVYITESVVFVFNLFCTYAYYYRFDSTWFNVFHIIISSMTLISFYVSLNFAIKASVWQLEEVENELEKKNYNLQLFRNKEKQEMYESVKKYNHDVKNLVYSASILLNDKKYDKLKELLSITEKEVHDNSNRIRIYSNNDLIDSILYELSLRCKHKEIDFVSSCMIPETLTISDVDLSRIFNNLIDNAMEAISNIQQGERRILIKSYEEAGLFTLLVQNTYNANKILMSKKKLYTTKKNKEFHGLGITNIKELVTKNAGDTNIIINEHNGTFSFYVIFTVD